MNLQGRRKWRTSGRAAQANWVARGHAAHAPGSRRAAEQDPLRAECRADRVPRAASEIARANPTSASSVMRACQATNPPINLGQIGQRPALPARGPAELFAKGCPFVLRVPDYHRQGQHGRDCATLPTAASSRPAQIARPPNQPQQNAGPNEQIGVLGQQSETGKQAYRQPPVGVARRQKLCERHAASPQNRTDAVSGVMITPPTASSGMASAIHTARRATIEPRLGCAPSATGSAGPAAR